MPSLIPLMIEIVASIGVTISEVRYIAGCGLAVAGPPRFREGPSGAQPADHGRAPRSAIPAGDAEVALAPLRRAEAKSKKIISSPGRQIYWGTIEVV
jgi:hypothetical protein